MKKLFVLRTFTEKKKKNILCKTVQFYPFSINKLIRMN